MTSPPNTVERGEFNIWEAVITADSRSVRPCDQLMLALAWDEIRASPVSAGPE